MSLVSRHDRIAVVHRLGDDHRHQAVVVGDLLGVARLQRRQRRQEAGIGRSRSGRRRRYRAPAACRRSWSAAPLPVIELGLAPRQCLVCPDRSRGV